MVASAPTLDVGAVVMAGGAGTRLGPLGRALPKCLLPLGDGQNLLSRLLGQLQAAGVRQVTLCCSPGNHSRIRAELESFNTARADLADAVLSAVACPDCSLGPLPALAEALTHSTGRWRLLCLADIYFATDPFSGFMGELSRRGGKAIDGCLLTGSDQMAGNGNGSGSGAVFSKGSIVQSVSYHVSESMAGAATAQRRWSGAFFFRESLVRDLIAHRFDYRHAPLENWVQGSIERGAVCSWMDVGEFVNVNSEEDYAFLTRSTGGS
jgi:NDP-sugar pyrophosphorylase family protein